MIAIEILVEMVSLLAIEILVEMDSLLAIEPVRVNLHWYYYLAKIKTLLVLSSQTNGNDAQFYGQEYNAFISVDRLTITSTQYHLIWY